MFSNDTKKLNWPCLHDSPDVSTRLNKGSVHTTDEKEVWHYLHDSPNYLYETQTRIQDITVYQQSKSLLSTKGKSYIKNALN